MSFIADFRELVQTFWSPEEEEEETADGFRQPAASPVVHRTPPNPRQPTKMAGGTAYHTRASFMEGAIQDEESDDERDGSVIYDGSIIADGSEVYDGSYLGESSILTCDGSIVYDDSVAVASSMRGRGPVLESGARRPPAWHGPSKMAGGTVFESRVEEPRQAMVSRQVAGSTAYEKREEVLPEQRFVSPPMNTTTGGVSQQPPQGANQQPPSYHAAPGDPLDAVVAEFFRQRPTFSVKHSAALVRISAGRYAVYGREVTMEMTVSSNKRKLWVKDGPLKQPLDDYLDNKDATAEYNGSVFQTRKALEKIPQDCKMTFHDTGAGYTRIEAMKVAKEQALVREKAASGQAPAGDLRSKYDKTIDAKLGKSRNSLATPQPVVALEVNTTKNRAAAPAPQMQWPTSAYGFRTGFSVNATHPA
jgi:hypothetical protein